jgi:hypothetical protein
MQFGKTSSKIKNQTKQNTTKNTKSTNTIKTKPTSKASLIL